MLEHAHSNDCIYISRTLGGMSTTNIEVDTLADCFKQPNVVNFYGFIRTPPLGVDIPGDRSKHPNVMDLVWTSSEEPVQVYDDVLIVHGTSLGGHPRSLEAFYERGSP